MSRSVNCSLRGLLQLQLRFFDCNHFLKAYLHQLQFFFTTFAATATEVGAA